MSLCNLSMSGNLVSWLTGDRFLVDWRLLVKEWMVNIGIPLDILNVCGFDGVFLLLHFCIFLVLGYLQISLLCIMGELTGGRSVAVTVGVIDMWQVKRDMWQLKHDFFLFFSFCPFLSVLVCVLISENLKLFSVSRKQNLLFIKYIDNDF